MEQDAGVGEEREEWIWGAPSFAVEAVPDLLAELRLKLREGFGGRGQGLGGHGLGEHLLGRLHIPLELEYFRLRGRCGPASEGG